jgi:plastocyanin
MRTRSWVLLAAVVMGAGGCGGSGGSYGSGPNNNNPGGSTSKQVSVKDNVFEPAATTVPLGSTVTWTWQGSQNHNVTFDDGEKSANQATGGYTRVFGKAGAYPYHCTNHGAMTGTVTVQ